MKASLDLAESVLLQRSSARQFWTSLQLQSLPPGRIAVILFGSSRSAVMWLKAGSLEMSDPVFLL
jgi:hypothetical protein